MKNYAINLKLPVQFIKQKGQYIAWTPILDLSTSGRSQKQAEKRFEEAVELFLEELVEAGTIDEVLTSLGWKKEQKSWMPPKMIKQQTVTLSVPAMA